MSNTYGFDFLRAQHRLDGEGRPVVAISAGADGATGGGDGPPPPAPAAADANLKSDLEKQFDILAFLQAHRGRGSGSCFPPSVIRRSTGIDLDDAERNRAVVGMLRRNPKVRVEMVPDPENPALALATYGYQAKYGTVHDRTTLLAQINRMNTGVPVRDLLDSYVGVEDDLRGLIAAGDVIAIQNTEDKDKILFPRGEAFLVELDGLLTISTTTATKREDEQASGTVPPPSNPQNGNDKAPHSADGTTNGKPADEQSFKRRAAECFIVETDVDPRTQIRRGEAVCVGGQWFRVSSAVREGVPLSEQPARAQAPLSVVSLTDLSKKNESDGYIRPFTSKQIPLDASLTKQAKDNVLAARAARDRLLKLAHGRSGGVAGQLTGSYAHSSNPTTLAASFASSTAAQSMRRRPTAAVNNKKNSSAQAEQPPHHHQQQQQQLSKADLEKAAADPALALYSHARRHGCTRDVREMYLATRSSVPDSDHDLHRVLLEHKLLEPGEQMRRPRLTKTGANVDNDGKPKKRRYYERKNQRNTNTHLEGTEIGAILARAAEKQKQGKSVGDGGM
jgi:hypothetical protein